MRNQELIDSYIEISDAENLAYYIKKASQEVTNAVKSIKRKRIVDLRGIASYNIENAFHSGDHNEILVPFEPFPKPDYPRKFEYPNVVWWFDHKGHYVSLATGIVLSVIVGNINDWGFGGSLLFVPIGILLAFLVWGMLTDHVIEPIAYRRNRQHYDELCRKNDEERKQIEAEENISFEQEKEKIDQYNYICENAKNELRKEKAFLDEKLKTIEIKIEILYERQSIPLHMRGFVASHNILQYLETGYLKLEGPGGAFEQYYMDLRTDRICDSLAKVEAAVRVGTMEIIQSQARLCREIENVNTRIDSFSSSVSAEMDRLARENRKISGSLKDIVSIDKTIAWNQYIAEKEAGINEVLLRKP